MLIQRQMRESMERLANRDKEVRPAIPASISRAIQKFYIRLYLQHPYWSLYEFERTGPVIIGDVPDPNQYRIEYNEASSTWRPWPMLWPAASGKRAAPGQTVAAAAAAAVTAPPMPSPRSKYKDLPRFRHHHRRGIHRQEKATHGHLNSKNPGSNSRVLLC